MVKSYVHIVTATGNSSIAYLDICDFVPHSVKIYLEYESTSIKILDVAPS